MKNCEFVDKTCDSSSNILMFILIDIDEKDNNVK